MTTSQPYPYAPWPSYSPEGWLFDEDRALRDLMKGMVVTDHENSSRPVEAWFGHPDQELREQKYPYVTVDLLNVQEGIGRVHREFVTPERTAVSHELEVEGDTGNAPVTA